MVAAADVWKTSRKNHQRFKLSLELSTYNKFHIMTQSLYGVFHHAVLELLLLLHHVRRLAPGRQKCLWSDQCCESGFTESGSGSSIRSESGSRVFMTKNWRKKADFALLLFLTKKIVIYLSLGLHKGRTNYRRSLQIQNTGSETHLHTVVFINNHRIMIRD